MKTALHLALLSCLGTLAVSQVSANLVVNGDFEAGNTGFTTDYTFSGAATTTDMWPEGTYNVDTNPQLHHYLWNNMTDHSGTGNMLMVNGSPTAGVKVWQGQFSPPALTVGTTYKFSAWVANVYPTAAAELKFSVDGVQIGSNFTPTGNGVWQEFTATFVAGASATPVFLDLNTVRSGNDFAVDDISVIAVPEPTTMIAGALLLLPFGASTIRILRRNRAA